MNRKRVVVVLANTAYGRRVMHGITNYAVARGGWEFFYKASASDPKVLFKAVAAAEMWADGIIGHFIDQPFLSSIQRIDIPAVNVSSWFETLKPVRVHTNEALIGQCAAEYFITRGVRSFAYWGSTFGAYSAHRRDGFQQALKAKGFDCEIFDSTVPPELSRREWILAEEHMGQRLAQMEKPVGLLCVNDMLAREVLWVAERLGLHCPDDLAVLGVENDELACSVCIPPLSSIELAAARIGHDAAALLDQMMAGQSPSAAAVLIPPIGVVTRQSTDVVAVANPEVREAIRFIRDHAHEPIDVRDVLRAVPVSRRAMEIQFKQVLQRTPRQQIQFERVQLAKRLLLETDLPISQLAQRAGFSSPSLFWVIFRRFTGMGPKEFRRRFL
jgi:LacI family transcriptional regulator